MSRRVYLGAVALLGALLVLAEFARVEPVDWRYSFAHDDTRPYGGAVAFALLDGWFDVAHVAQPPFVALRRLAAEKEGTDDPERRTYVFLTDVFEPDAVEAEALLAFAAAGHTVFVAAERIQGPFADSLGVASRFMGRPPRTDAAPALQRWRHVRTDTTLHLASPALARAGGYALEAHVPVHRFTDLEADGATVLGTIADDRVNYARLPVGEGQVLVHATPTVFANAVLLADSATPGDPDATPGAAADYLAAALAYLPDQPVLWDGYYKPGRDLSTSPLRYVFETAALRGAYLTLLLGVVLFFLLRARRWQRAIPVVQPPPNAMAAFVEHVGRLYHERGDTQALARDLRRVLLDRLRRRAGLADLDLTPASAARVAERLGRPEAEVRTLFARLRRAEAQPVSDDDLLDLDHRIHALTQA